MERIFRGTLEKSQGRVLQTILDGDPVNNLEQKFQDETYNVFFFSSILRCFEFSRPNRETDDGATPPVKFLHDKWLKSYVGGVRNITNVVSKRFKTFSKVNNLPEMPNNGYYCFQSTEK